jgi:hypothetical protein
LDELIAGAGPASPITFMAVPHGLGQRLGIDRDEDGRLDYSEVLSGGDPANANESGGGGGGGCFIATAAYGTPLDGRIEILRTLRDDSLLTNPAGAAFTDAYYRISPAATGALIESPRARFFVRLGLRLVLFAAQFPLSLSTVPIGLAMVVFLTRRRRTG